jgi:hypothetical protein
MSPPKLPIHVARRVDQAHVLDLELLDHQVVAAAVEVVNVAAIARIAFAFGHGLLRTLVDGVVTLQAADAVEAPGQARADVGDRFGHVQALVRIGRQFRRDVLREKAVDHQVLLFGRVELDDAEAAMMIGRDQAIRRQEGTGAIPETDDGVQRVVGQRRQILRIEFQTARLQLGFDRRQLRRRPHALVGGNGSSDKRDGKCGESNERTHGRTSDRSAKPRFMPEGQAGCKRNDPVMVRNVGAVV